MKKKKKINIPTIIFITLIIFGISIMILPVIDNFINSKKYEAVINNYAIKVNNLSDDKYDELFNEAYEYNKNLTSISIIDAFTSETKVESTAYENLLKINDDGVMGYIKIPKINVEIPIYHGTSSEVLHKGVGHFESSSLPVGGEGTHSVLSAHRGLPSARLFTDLDQLKEGDLFYIYVLNKVLAYQVDQIRVIEPSDVSEFEIKDGEDYITLVTCTPYAVNTHRLLVRGTRVEYNEEVKESIRIEKKLTKADIILIAGLIFVFIIIILVFIIIRKINKQSNEMLEKNRNQRKEILDNIVFDKE